MRISELSNSLITIKARNEADYEQALQVADKMESDTDRKLVVVSGCDYEWWVQLSTKWHWGQAEDLREVYQSAKKSI